MPTSFKGSPAVDVGSMNRHKWETKKLEKKSPRPILSFKVLPLWRLELMWEHGGEPAPALLCKCTTCFTTAGHKNSAGMTLCPHSNAHNNFHKIKKDKVTHHDMALHQRDSSTFIFGPSPAYLGIFSDID